jgi:hypothetical protein
MDKRFELAEALMDLSRASERVAKLITQTAIGEVGSETILTASGSSTETIDANNISGWPLVPSIVSGLDLSFDMSLYRLTVLEFHRGPNIPITANHNHATSIDIITDSYTFKEQPQNVKIISPKECRKRYDLGVIYESLEFTNDPATILAMFKRCCKKIVIRFRPWTSSDGAFLHDKAFLHLVQDTDNSIQFKVTRPLASYESLIKSMGLSTDERRINTRQLNQFFIDNEQIMRVLRERTWGNIDYEQAVKILTIDSVDYVLNSDLR